MTANINTSEHEVIRLVRNHSEINIYEGRGYYGELRNPDPKLD